MYPLSPSDLTGFLIPSDTPFEDRGEVDEDDSLDEVSDTAGLVEESADERSPVPARDSMPSTAASLFRLQAVPSDGGSTV